jgi:hypothetical protein
VRGSEGTAADAGIVNCADQVDHIAPRPLLAREVSTFESSIHSAR